MNCSFFFTTIECTFDIPKNRRHSEGGSQTCSKLFELELSPILEDAHWNDVYFGPVAPGREGSNDGTSSSTGGTSDSSLGEPLELKVRFTMRDVVPCLNIRSPERSSKGHAS